MQSDSALEHTAGQRKSQRQGWDFALGVAVGWAIAPLFGLISFARRARTFHPRGQTFHAVVSRHADVSPALAPLAERLVGPALARFSGALWKNAPSVPDVLGCAIRLRRDQSATAQAAPDDQDLLFATIRRPWTMAFSPFTTEVSDYLANDYFAVSPFDVELADARFYLRLHPARPCAAGDGTRGERLLLEAGQGRAELSLELGSGPSGPWSPLVRVTLEEPAAIDGQALRFRPFREGRGVHPRGFVHALRLGVYAFSQWARPARSLNGRASSRAGR